MKKCKRKRCKCKNSKVFEQKGDLLSFKVNIDPKSGLMLSCAEPSRVEHFLDTISNFVITKLLFTYKAYILSRIKRAILFDKSKIALKMEKYILVILGRFL